jgi:hypothetical protein
MRLGTRLGKRGGGRDKVEKARRRRGTWDGGRGTGHGFRTRFALRTVSGALLAL